MKYFFFILILIISIPCLAQSKKSETFYDANRTRIQEVYYLVNNIKNGSYKYYNTDGIVTKEGIYINGKLNGVFKERYDNGNLHITAFYKNDQLEGKLVQYFSNGLIEVEVNFLKGLRNGKYTEFYENSFKKKEVVYASGKEESLKKLYYLDGKVQTESEMTSGYLNGAIKDFYPSGILRYSGNMNMGKKDGPFKQYYENGKLEIEGSFINDQQDGKSYDYTKEGDLLAVTTLRQGIKDGLQMLYSKRKVFTITNSWENGKLYQPGTVEFSSSVATEENKGFTKMFHGTEYGIETDWFVVGGSKYLTKGFQIIGDNGTFRQPENTREIDLRVKISKRFSRPDIIYILFKLGNEDFRYYNLNLSMDSKMVFNNYYNFGISKWGKIYNPNIFLNIDCNQPSYTVSIATVNPNAEYDDDNEVSDEEKILRRPKKAAPRNAIAWLQERGMNKTFGGETAPDRILVNSNCNLFSQFQQLIKLAALN